MAFINYPISILVCPTKLPGPCTLSLVDHPHRTTPKRRVAFLGTWCGKESLLPKLPGNFRAEILWIMLKCPWTLAILKNFQVFHSLNVWRWKSLIRQDSLEFLEALDLKPCDVISMGCVNLSNFARQKSSRYFMS